MFVGLTSFKESFGKIIHSEITNYTTASLLIITVGVLVKFLLERYVKQEGKKYNSESLIASGTDADFDSFYVDMEKMQISFDLIIDFESGYKEAIRNALVGQMKQFYPEYGFTVILDSHGKRTLYKLFENL